MRHSSYMSSKYVLLKSLARTTGLPAAWLRREADAGRLPYIKAGRVRMFDPEAVTAALKRLQEGEVINDG